MRLHLQANSPSSNPPTGSGGGALDAFTLITNSSLVTAIGTLGSSTEADLLRVHTDFSRFTLLAGDYWIGISGAVNETPEPATAAMVAAALVLMGGLRRRRIGPVPWAAGIGYARASQSRGVAPDGRGSPGDSRHR